MTCKAILNRDSGNCSRINIEKLLCTLGCDETEIEIVDSNTDWNANGFDKVIVCGGDGTLHNALERCWDKQIIYVPCGTLNEASCMQDEITTVGLVDGKPFTYVCATGSFTEIGYYTKNAAKQRFKQFAYLPQIFKCYHCHDIHANLNVDGQNFEGNYTLIMVLKSHRCFGFSFNKSYRKQKGLFLLAIKSFGRDNFINRTKMFFPLFRIFFCGVKHAVINKRWMLLPFKQLTVELNESQDFCIDGEKQTLAGKLIFEEQCLKHGIKIVKTPFCRGKKAK